MASKENATTKAIKKLVKVVQDKPKMTGVFPFAGAWVLMRKSAFKTDRKLLDQLVFRTAIVDGAGTAALQLVTVGTSFPILMQQIAHHKSGVKTLPGHRMLPTVLVLSGGDALYTDHFPKPEGISDQKMFKLLENFAVENPEDEVLPGAQLEHLSRDITPEPEYVQGIFDKYFKDMVGDEPLSEFVLYMMGNAPAWISIAQQGFMKDQNEMNICENVRVGPDDDRCFVSNETFEVTVDNEALNLSCEENKRAYFRGFFIERDPIFDDSCTKELFSKDSTRRKKLKTVENFATSFEHFQYTRSDENVIDESKFVSSKAATMLFNTFPNMYNIVSRYTVKAGDTKTRPSMAVRLDALKSMIYKSEEPDANNMSKTDEAGMALLGALERSVISPTMLLSYRNGKISGKGSGLSSELMDEEFKSIWLHSDVALKHETLSNMKRNGGDEIRQMDEDFLQILAGNYDVSTDLLMIFDFKSMFHTSIVETKKELCDRLGESLDEDMMMARKYQVMNANNPLFSRLKSPAAKILFSLNGDVGAFITGVVNKCLFVMSRGEMDNCEIEVTEHPGMLATETPEYCSYCQTRFNNGETGGNRDYCLCYLFLRTMAKLKNEPVDANTMSINWNQFLTMELHKPNAVEDRRNEFGMNASYRVIDQGNNAGYFADIVLENEKDNGFLDSNAAAQLKENEEYKKTYKLSNLREQLLAKFPTVLPEGFKMDMNEQEANDGRYTAAVKNHDECMKFMEIITKTVFQAEAGQATVGSYSLDEFTAMKKVLLSDPSSENDYTLTPLYQSENAHLIKGTKKPEDDKDDEMDEASEILCGVSRKRKMATKEGGKKKAKMQRKRAHDFARALLLNLLEHGIDREMPPGAEMNHKYQQLLAQGQKAACQEIFPYLYRFLTADCILTEYNMRQTTYNEYMKGWGDYIHNIYEGIKDKLNYASDAEFRKSVNSGIKHKNKSVKKSIAFQLDPWSTQSPIQQSIERKMIYTYTKHRHEVDIGRGAPNAKLYDSDAYQMFQQKIGLKCSNIVIPGRYVLPCLTEGYKAGTNRFMYNEKLLAEEENELNIQKSEDHIYITTLSSKTKTDTYAKENKDIEDERWDKKSSKENTEALNKAIGEIKSTTQPGTQYSPFPIMQQDCKIKGISSNNEHNIIPTSALATFFRSSNVNFPLVNSGNFCERGSVEAAEKYVKNYLNVNDNTNVATSALVACIIKDLKALNNAVNVLSLACREFFTYKLGWVNNLTTLEKITRVSEYKRFIDGVLSKKEGDEAAIFHLIIAMSEVYDYNISPCNNKFYDSFTRDNLAINVCISGILSLFLGIDKTELTNSARSNSDRQRKMRPIITTMLDYNMINGQMDQLSVLDIVTMKGVAKVVSGLTVMSYPGVSAEDLFTKWKSGPFFCNKSLSGVVAGDTFKNRKQCGSVFIKCSGVHFPNYKKKVFEVNVSDLITTGDFEEIKTAMRDSKHVIKDMVNLFCDYLGVELPETGALPDVGSLTEAEFVTKIVAKYFSNYASVLGEKHVKEEILCMVLPYIFASGNKFTEDQDEIDLDADMDCDDYEEESDGEDMDVGDDDADVDYD